MIASPLLHFRRRRRDRAFSSKERSGRFARNRVWTLVETFLRAHWIEAVLTACVPSAAGAVVAVFEHGADRWIVATACVVSGLWLAAGYVLLYSGAPAILMGLLAEQASGEALKTLRSQGWHVLNGARLNRAGDIDHVVVGPRGLAVIETKWSADAWPNEDAPERAGDFMHKRLRQATEFAHARRCELRDALGDARLGTPVGAAVVLTGPAATQLPAAPFTVRPHVNGTKADEVTVLPLHGLARWLADGRQDRLDEVAVEWLWTAVIAVATAEQDPTPLRPTLRSWSQRYVLVPGAVAAIALAAPLIVRHFGPWQAILATSAAEVPIGPVASRLGRLRLPAWACTVVGCFWCVLFIGGVIVELLR